MLAHRRRPGRQNSALDRDATSYSATTPQVSTDPGTAVRPGRSPSSSACEPYRELIVEALARGRNAMAIWQDLVDDHGFAARYSSVRRFVVHLRGSKPVDARVVISTATRSGSIRQMVWNETGQEIPVLRQLRPALAEPASLGLRHRFVAERVLTGEP
jgi:hypothetical protein